MKKKIDTDGSVSYAFTQTEKVVFFSVLAFMYGRRVGYYQGRISMSKEIDQVKKAVTWE